MQAARLVAIHMEQLKAFAEQGKYAVVVWALLREKYGETFPATKTRERWTGLKIDVPWR